MRPQGYNRYIKSPSLHRLLLLLRIRIRSDPDRFCSDLDPDVWDQIRNRIRILTLKITLHQLFWCVKIQKYLRNLCC
jgi:hypothetical protein